MTDLAALRARFTEVIDDETALRAATGDAHRRALDKVVEVIDDHARRFIAAAPFAFIASAGPDCSPLTSPASAARRKADGNNC